MEIKRITTILPTMVITTIGKIATREKYGNIDTIKILLPDGTLVESGLGVDRVAGVGVLNHPPNATKLAITKHKAIADIVVTIERMVVNIMVDGRAMASIMDEIMVTIAMEVNIMDGRMEMIAIMEVNIMGEIMVSPITIEITTTTTTTTMAITNMTIDATTIEERGAIEVIVTPDYKKNTYARYILPAYTATYIPAPHTQ